MQTPRITILLPDIRSAYNVGAIFRTADATGISVWTSGITVHPRIDNDSRPPHIIDRAQSMLHKTALGAEMSVPHRYFEFAQDAVHFAQKRQIEIVCLEQSEHSVDIFNYIHQRPMLLIMGNEVDGVDDEILNIADTIVEIPMQGSKESLNVSVAAGIAMYQLISRK